MPILYERTDRLVKSFAPDVGSDLLIFVAGVFTGFIVLPLVLPIAGYQLTKRWGPPPPPPR